MISWVQMSQMQMHWQRVQDHEHAVRKNVAVWCFGCVFLCVCVLSHSVISHVSLDIIYLAKQEKAVCMHILKLFHYFVKEKHDKGSVFKKEKSLKTM